MRVSILMPCYNAESFISASINSLIAQTWKDIEIVVTNDGSTDSSASILARYSQHGVRVIHQSNRGQCAAANSAFRGCTGQLIKFFDADDIMEPDMIERQIKQLGGRTDAIAMGEWQRFYGEQPTDDTFPKLPMYRDARPVDWLVQEWANSRPMMQCGLWLIPRQIIEQRGLWDERLSLINDFEYFARLLTGASDIVYTPGARMHYRSGLPSSLSGQRSRKAVESAHLSLMLGTQHLLDAEDSSRTRKVCANVLQDFEYTYYPDHSDLRASMRARVRELGGSDLEPDGPPGFHMLKRFTGWKLARHVQRLAERRGWNGAARASNGRDIVT
jgi:glycosyltransferase involved in cell wall biosynthesis